MRVTRHAKADVHTVTDARRPLSEDIGKRERRYLITMGVRLVCFVLATVIAVTAPGHWRVLALVAVAGAIILPYVAVVFANGGREPDSSARFAPYEPETTPQQQISGPSHEIRS